MELPFLHWLRENIPPAPNIALGIGDDAALLNQRTGKQTVVTTDMLMDGVDFIAAQGVSPQDRQDWAQIVGRKALAVNLSDLAAMGAKPVAAFVSLAVLRDGKPAETLEFTKRLMQGVQLLADEFGCAIAGGDTNSWLGPLVISITAIGEVDTGMGWLRSGARPGDAILVTGSFGGSLRFGRHLTFTPRVREALQLRSMNAEIHAAIDVSDGLSLDLSRIAEASKCGACVHVAKIPIHADAIDRERKHEDGSISVLLDGLPPLQNALSDGEDFELILAVPPHEAERLLRDQPLDIRLTQIGWFTAEPGLTQQLPSGEVLPLQPRGYEH
jgi:thiamine-monophosphate kinase